MSTHFLIILYKSLDIFRYQRYPFNQYIKYFIIRRLPFATYFSLLLFTERLTITVTTVMVGIIIIVITDSFLSNLLNLEHSINVFFIFTLHY